MSGMYGPFRVNNFSGGKLSVIRKNNHYFSRIHILDAARLVSKIILQNPKNEIWNLCR